MSVSYTPHGYEKTTISDLVRELFSKTSEFLHTQLELTKTEIKVESRKLVVAVVYGMAALTIGFVFLLFFGISLILLLSMVMDLVWASLITTGVYLLGAVIAAALMLVELRKNKGTIEV